jgi:hypothetical protein
MGIYWNRHNLELTVKNIYIFYSDYYRVSSDEFLKIVEDTVLYMMKRTSDRVEEDYARNSIRNTIYSLYNRSKIDTFYHLDPIFLNKTVIEIMSCGEHHELDKKKGIVTRLEKDNFSNIVYAYGTWGDNPVNLDYDLLEIWNK